MTQRYFIDVPSATEMQLRLGNNADRLFLAAQKERLFCEFGLAVQSFMSFTQSSI